MSIEIKKTVNKSTQDSDWVFVSETVFTPTEITQSCESAHDTNSIHVGIESKAKDIWVIVNHGLISGRVSWMIKTYSNTRPELKRSGMPLMHSSISKFEGFVFADIKYRLYGRNLPTNNITGPATFEVELRDPKERTVYRSSYTTYHVCARRFLILLEKSIRGLSK
jgi:hypothetical protein